MGTKYGTILVGGVVQTYNDDPPNDNAEQTEANRVKYITVTGDLSSPLHSAITRMDGKLLDQVDEGPTPKSSAYTTTLPDHNTVIECTGTFTLDLLAPSGNAGYKVIAKNAGSGGITVEVDGGSNVDGAASLILTAGEAREFYVNDAGTAYYSTTGGAASGVTPHPIIITTRGDVIRGDTSGDAERLALGTTGQLLRSDGTDIAYDNQIFRETAQVTTSGTAFTFSNAPSWTTRVMVLFNEVSLDGTDDIIVQLGDSGGIEATGYVSSTSFISGGTTGVASSTAGLIVEGGGAGALLSGNMIIANISGNLWVESHAGKSAPTVTTFGGGSKTLSALLTQVRVTRTGTDNFDNGSVVVLYE